MWSNSIAAQLYVPDMKLRAGVSPSDAIASSLRCVRKPIHMLPTPTASIDPHGMLT